MIMQVNSKPIASMISPWKGDANTLQVNWWQCSANRVWCQVSKKLKLATGSCYQMGLSKDDDGGCRRVQFH